MVERAVKVWEWIAAAHEGAGPVSIGALCRAAVRALGMDGASVTAARGRAAREPLFASDLVSAQLEELQFTLGEGPGTDEVGPGSPTLIPGRRRYHPRRRPGAEAAHRGAGNLTRRPAPRRRPERFRRARVRPGCPAPSWAARRY